jgi:hypothetical protein
MCTCFCCAICLVAVASRNLLKLLLAGHMSTLRLLCFHCVLGPQPCCVPHCHSQAADVAPGGPTPQAPQPLRELLEREVAEHKAHLERRRASVSRLKCKQFVVRVAGVCLCLYYRAVLPCEGRCEAIRL